VGVVCDASIQSFMLTHWTKERSRGPRLPLAEVVKTMTADTADAYGLEDRGRLAPGYRADINLIDYEALTLHAPYMAHDLPTDAKRLLQRSTGIRKTYVAGQLAFEDGQATDARAGQLIRGPQPAPN
jgi:N-acyl-D-aspartate/D-glutamate deacylase